MNKSNEDGIDTGYLGKEKKSDKFFWAIAAVSIVAYLYGQGTSSTIPNNWLFPTLIMTAYLIGKTIEWHAKLRSPKAIIAPFQSTTNGVVEPAYGWNFLRLGGIRADWLDTAGNDGTAIFPESCHRMAGSSIVPNALFTIWPFAELTGNIQNYIVSRGLPAPYYLGLAPADAYVEDPDLEHIERLLRSTQRQLTQQDELLKGEIKMTERHVSAGKRLVDAAGKGSAIKRVKQRLTEDEPQ